jgi:3-deoxy-7-phosphoheptulonate synthase
MVIVMRAGAGEAQIHAVIDRLNAFGFDVHRSSGLQRTVLGAIGAKPGFDIRHIASLEGVEAVHRVTEPYGRVLRSMDDPEPRWSIGSRVFGPGRIAVVVSLVDADVHAEAIAAVVRSGADALSVPAPAWSAEAGAAASGADLPVLIEIAHGAQLPTTDVRPAAWRLTGTAMFERDLRHRIAALGAPVVVDRAPGSTIEEWLLAADDLLGAGSTDVALCDSGSRSLDPARSLAPDIAALVFAAVRTRLPVLADPGRAIADPAMALAAACAAVGAGARGNVLTLRDRKGEPDVAALERAGERLRAIAAAVGR